MRQRVLTGEVHDPNAWMLGGVAGHAGLFGTAADVALWGKVLLDIWQGRDGRLPPEIVRQFWSPDASPSSETTTWRLCFDGVSSQGSSTGQYFGSKAVGHLGFTGTSIWLEPEIDLVVVLLSNRVHPTVVEEPPIKAFRPRFHDAMYKAFGILGR
jgi:CubicO group peptidase (beta-lactamase class C family)